MNIIYTILFLVAIWYIAKLYSESTPEKRIEKFEEFADSMLESYRVIGRAAYGRENDEKEVSRMRDWYIRLKEKHKHDKKFLLRLAEDWKDYTFNLSQSDSAHYLSLEEQDSAVSEQRSQEAREASLRVVEIENRFADDLGQTFRQQLEEDRKKQLNAIEAFWNHAE